MVEPMIEINFKVAVIQHVSPLGPKITSTVSAMNSQIIDADEISKAENDFGVKCIGLLIVWKKLLRCISYMSTASCRRDGRENCTVLGIKTSFCAIMVSWLNALL